MMDSKSFIPNSKAALLEALSKMVFAYFNVNVFNNNVHFNVQSLKIVHSPLYAVVDLLTQATSWMHRKTKDLEF